MKEINLNQLSTKLLSGNSDLLSSVKSISQSGDRNGIGSGSGSGSGSKRGRPSKLSIDQIYECIMLKSQHSIQYWKCLFKLYQKIYPDVELPVYHNCLTSVYKFFTWLVRAINFILYENRKRFLMRRIRIAFMDSTPLPVCHIKRSSRHKTMIGLAQFSKGTMGWYFGLKLHLVIDNLTNLPIYAKFTKAKVDDRQVMKEIMEDDDLFKESGTMFVADKGYQASWLEETAYNTGNYLLTGKRKSPKMRILASQFDIHLLHHRARVETPFSKLKGKYNITLTKARSEFGYIFNYIFSLFSLVNERR
jgi:Transposase DDE domain